MNTEFKYWRCNIFIILYAPCFDLNIWWITIEVLKMKMLIWSITNNKSMSYSFLVFFSFASLHYLYLNKMAIWQHISGMLCCLLFYAAYFSSKVSSMLCCLLFFDLQLQIVWRPGPVLFLLFSADADSFHFQQIHRCVYNKVNMHSIRTLYFTHFH